MNKVNKWYTSKEYYNMENGEQITESEAKRKYLITGKTITFKIDENIGKKTINYHCRRNKQIKLW